MAARLCRRLLLADPTRILPRVAAASFSTPSTPFLLTPVAVAFLATLNPHCPTLQRSTPLAALPSPATRPAAPIGSRTSTVLCPATCSGASIPSRISAVTSPATRLHACSVPSPATCSPAFNGPVVLKLGDRSARTSTSPSPAVLAPHLSSLPHSMFALSSGKMKGRVAQLQSPLLLPQRGVSSDEKPPHALSSGKMKGRRAQPQSSLPHALSSGKMKGGRAQPQSPSLLPQRVVSSGEKPPPIRQLIFRDDALVSEEEWVDLTEFLQNHSLVHDARNNHLNMEVEGFGVRSWLNLSEDTGVPIIQNLVLLALANSNRGYCVMRSFTMDNLLVCPKLKQIMFKTVIFDDLEPEGDCSRAASYAAVGRLMREMLKANVGPDVIRQLLEEPRDLLSKLLFPSDERLIIYHPAFLLMDGRLWYYEKLYRLFFKTFPEIDKDEDELGVMSKSGAALSDMAYTDGNLLIFDIISSHPLLSYIERDRSDEAERPDESKGPGKVGKHKTRDLGRKVVALPRHTIEHAFDRGAKKIPSKQASRETLWPYSIHQVVCFLKSIMPLHLLKSQEACVSNALWPYLNIDSFWSRDLSWIGGVPAPTTEEKKAIGKVRYGKRRLQARKYD